MLFGDAREEDSIEWIGGVVLLCEDEHQFRFFATVFFQHGVYFGEEVNVVLHQEGGEKPSVIDFHGW